MRIDDIHSIVHINTNDLRGGAAKVPWRLAESQRESGYDSSMLVGYKESNSIHSFPLHIERDHQLSSDYRKGGLLYYDILSDKHVLDNALVRQADLLHLHNLHGDYLNPFTLSHLTQQKPTVWTLHDMQALTGHCAYSMDCNRWQDGCGQCPDLHSYPPVEKDATARLWRDKANIYRQSHLVIVTPSMWLKKIAEKGILGDFPIELIYNGVNTRVFYPHHKINMREKYGIPKETVVIGCVANGGSFTDKRKGGYYIRQAIDYLKGKDIDFLFVNIGDNHYFNDDPHIMNTGYIIAESQLSELYSAMDIFLFPSLADNCPLVISEALACGVPVVTFATGGIPELVNHCANGLVANYQDTPMLLQHLEQLISNASLRQQFSSQALVDAREKYDHDKISQQYLDLYHQCWEQFYRHKNSPVRTAVTLPKVLVVYTTDRFNYKDSETYRCLQEQNYTNFQIHIGSIDSIIMNQVNPDVICFVEEGDMLDPSFLTMMLYDYRGEDLVYCEMESFNKEGTARRYYPEVEIDGEKIRFSLEVKTGMIFNAKFVIENQYFLTGNVYISMKKFKKYNLKMGKVSLEASILRKLNRHTTENIYIYGGGTHTSLLCDAVDLSRFKIKGIIDKNRQLAGTQLNGYRIYNTEEMLQIPIDKILISSATYELEMYDELRNHFAADQLIKIYGSDLLGGRR